MGARVAVLCSVKNEVAYIVDWIAYQKSIGIDQIYIAQNNSVDGTDLLCEALAAAGYIHYIDNSDPQTHPHLAHLPAQKRALVIAKSQAEDCDYVFPLDIDEFPELSTEEDLPSLLNRLKFPDAVSFCWRMMGASGRTHYEPGPVFDRFDQAARSNDLGGKRPFHQFKTLFRSQLTKHFNVHRPIPHEGEIWRWLSPNGQDIFSVTSQSNILINYDFSVSQLRHYHVKSLEEFKLKMMRGYASHGSKPLPNIGLPAFGLMDRNDVYLPAKTKAFSKARSIAKEIRANEKIAAHEVQGLARFQKLLNYAAELIDNHSFFKVSSSFSGDISVLIQSEVYDKL